MGIIILKVFFWKEYDNIIENWKKVRLEIKEQFLKPK